MGKMAIMALANGISGFDEDLMRSSIRTELKNHHIPEATVRRARYKPLDNPDRSTMDALSDAIKTTLPPEFDGFPNHIINSFVKLVITSDESDARSAIRKKQLKGLRDLALREQKFNTATAESGYAVMQIAQESAAVARSKHKSEYQQAKTNERHALLMFDNALTTTELDTSKSINEEKTSVIKKDEAAVKLGSTKRLKAMKEETQLEKLLEARARREIAAMELAQKIKDRDSALLAEAQATPLPPPPAALVKKGRKVLTTKGPTGLNSLNQPPVRPLEDVGKVALPAKNRKRVKFVEGTK